MSLTPTDFLKCNHAWPLPVRFLYTSTRGGSPMPCRAIIRSCRSGRFFPLVSDFLPLFGIFYLTFFLSGLDQGSFLWQITHFFLSTLSLLCFLCCCSFSTHLVFFSCLYLFFSFTLLFSSSFFICSLSWYCFIDGEITTPPSDSFLEEELQISASLHFSLCLFSFKMRAYFPLLRHRLLILKDGY